MARRISAGAPAAFDIAVQRLHNERLTGAPFDEPEQVVRWLGAVQAQDFAGAKWAVAQRTSGATTSELDRLFNDGKILRTHVLRPTWHFVMPADIRWMLELTAPRIRAASAYYYRKLELDAAVFRRGSAALAKALAGGVTLTRTEIARVYATARIPANGLRLGYLLMHAELDALICSGPLRGKQFTYALLDERVPKTKRLGRQASLAALSRRYFESHGPALVKDFAWWAGLTVTEAKQAVDLARPELLHETVGEKTYWFSAIHAAARVEKPAVHLLPNYDEYLIAYKDHATSFTPSVLETVMTDASALQGHIVVLDGKVVGGWRRTIEKKSVLVTTQLLIRLSKAERGALKSVAERYSRFMGMPVRVAPSA